MEHIHYQALLLNNVRDAIVVWDTRGTIRHWNFAASVLFGFPPKERVGKSIEDCYLNEFDPPVFVQPGEGTGGQEIGRRYTHPDGRTIWVSSRVNPLRDYGAHNQLIGYMDVTRDITNRKQAEDALRASEERYRTVSELVSDFVYALSLEESGSFHFEWATDSLTRLVGLDLQGLNLERDWQRFIHQDDLPTIQKMAAEMHAGRSHICEFRLIAKDGREIWLQNYARPVADRNHNGRIRIFGAGKNISEQKLMQKQIQDAQLRLANSARLAAIGELASGVAHHINNPLTTIIAETQLLLHNLSENSVERESAEAIEHAGWRVQKAVQQLLEFSRPTGSSLEAVCVNKTIEAALSLIGDHIISFGVTLKTDLAEELPHLTGNERQLNDLWTNLLLLARDATSDGEPHQITIRTRCISPHEVLVEIGDDGKLIPEQEMRTLFEPDFIRPLGGRGTGIELNICQEIVRQHKGEITAVSNPDEGTVFRVSFPVDL